MNAIHMDVAHDPAWYKALTLDERREGLAELSSPHGGARDGAQSERRWKRWRARTPFGSDDHFARRLAVDRLTETEFIYLLGEPPETLSQRVSPPPRWIAQFTEAFSDSSHSVSEARHKEGVGGFFNLVDPLVRRARQTLRERMQSPTAEATAPLFDPETVDAMLVTNLAPPLLSILTRTLVLELNVARLRGVLEGETAEERFRSFVERLHQPEVALSIFQEYPVLARQVQICIDQWLDYSLEFLRHLREDWQTLQHTFWPNRDPGPLVRVEANAGDNHQRGRSVMIVTFSSGDQLVYKPKPLATDVHFQELLSWLNERGFQPAFQPLKIVNRGSYGWVQFVNAEGCSSQEELQRFYERQGGYLALLYALEAVDFHYENLIAAGDHPVLIDLESLFHPRIKGIVGTQAEDGHLAHDILLHSVLRVGLLPQRVWSSHEAREGVDISGMGGAEGQLTPHEVLTWRDAGTDEMRFTRARTQIPSRQNRPSLDGIGVNPLNYTESIVTGFRTMYRLLLQHRDALLAADGPILRFAEAEMRFIVRPTMAYGMLLEDSFHPDMLRDALDREQHFDRLWSDYERNPFLARVIPAERIDLQRNDIPLFIIRPSSRDLWSSTGERIPDFFEQSGMESVQERFLSLSDEDLHRQLWFIRASLTTLAMGGDQAGWPAYHLEEPAALAESAQLLAAACAIGDRLDQLAVGDERGVSWLGVSLIHERYWSLLPLGADLYGGLPGVILFLAYLGKLAEEDRYTRLAQAALHTLRSQIGQEHALIPSIGAFSGWGGLIYTLVHLGVLWERRALLDEAQEFVSLLPDLIAQDENLDVISGAAGCLGGLCTLYTVSPDAALLDAMVRCGDRLLSKAALMREGIGWWIPGVESQKPMAGFSHGAAGIGWALLELAVVTGGRRFWEAARAAIAYERTLFSLGAKNWPDLRLFDGTTIKPATESDAVPFMTAWCHGAPGIGMARLKAMSHLDDPALAMEVEMALGTTLEQGFGLNHSLCHGDLGNLELLLQASEAWEDAYWRAQTYRLAAMILDSSQKHGWLCGVPLGVETPGLMTGLAGIGYGLLRLAASDRVPSILTLEPPRPE